MSNTCKCVNFGIKFKQPRKYPRLPSHKDLRCCYIEKEILNALIFLKKNFVITGHFLEARRRRPEIECLSHIEKSNVRRCGVISNSKYFSLSWLLSVRCLMIPSKMTEADDTSHTK
jgi:hypothetical protein